MYLAGLSQILELNRILNLHGRLVLFECFVEGLGIQRSAVGITKQQAIVLVFFPKEFLMTLYGGQSFFDFPEERQR